MKPEDFKIAIITALPIELACVTSILDEKYEDIVRQPRDDNTYVFGQIGKHNIVIASLPVGVAGNTSAAYVTGKLCSSFPKLEFGLMVGVGGGVPNMEHGNKQDVRLGDVVVSKPTETHGGLVKFDLGKAIPGQQEGQASSEGFLRTGMLNRPPNIILTAVTKLQARHIQQVSNTPQYFQNLSQKFPNMQDAFTYPGKERDLLFQAEYDHPEELSDCTKCDPSKLVSRPSRIRQAPVVHYGTILTGDVVMRRGATREKLAREYHALCIEMEAAGISSTFPCLVIRGICDYADSHKNKDWQPYAAATAAAYTKELLSVIPPFHNDAELNPTQSSQALPGRSAPSFTINGPISSPGGNQVIGSTFEGPVTFGSPPGRGR